MALPKISDLNSKENPATIIVLGFFSLLMIAFIGLGLTFPTQEHYDNKAECMVRDTCTHTNFTIKLPDKDRSALVDQISTGLKPFATNLKFLFLLLVFVVSGGLFALAIAHDVKHVRLFRLKRTHDELTTTHNEIIIERENCKQELARERETFKHDLQREQEKSKHDLQREREKFGHTLQRERDKFEMKLLRANERLGAKLGDDKAREILGDILK